MTTYTKIVAVTKKKKEKTDEYLMQVF